MDLIGGQVDIQFKYVKLTFNVIEFQCNGLDPTVKSWGTANHVKIWDGKKSKTIDCGKKRQPPYYSTSDEIQVQLQVRTSVHFMQYANVIKRHNLFFGLVINHESFGSNRISDKRSGIWN